MTMRGCVIIFPCLLCLYLSFKAQISGKDSKCEVDELETVKLSSCVCTGEIILLLVSLQVTRIEE